MSYKYRLLYHFVYMWIFIFEIGLMVVGYFASRYNYIFIPILFVIFVFNIYAYVRQVSSIYVITSNGIDIKRKDKVMSILFEKMVSIRETVLYYEIEFWNKQKIKTIYFSKLIKDFEQFKTEIEMHLKEKEIDVLYF